MTMKDLRNTFSYKERLEFQYTVNSLRRYVVHILLKRQNALCAICATASDYYEIDHLIYNPRITINELRLLCWPCHRDTSDFSTLKNRRNPSKYRPRWK